MKYCNDWEYYSLICVRMVLALLYDATPSVDFGPSISSQLKKMPMQMPSRSSSPATFCTQLIMSIPTAGGREWASSCNAKSKLKSDDDILEGPASPPRGGSNILVGMAHEHTDKEDGAAWIEVARTGKSY